MKIIDINGNEREVKSITKIMHTKHSVLKGDKNKTVEKDPYIQAEIVGKNGSIWLEWYPLEEFKKMNLYINIDGVDK